MQVAQFVYGDRMRTRADKDRVSALIDRVFGVESKQTFPKFGIVGCSIQVGNVFLECEPRPGTFECPPAGVGELRLLHAQRQAMYSIVSCLKQVRFDEVAGNAMRLFPPPRLCI